MLLKEESPVVPVKRSARLRWFVRNNNKTNGKNVDTVTAHNHSSAVVSLGKGYLMENGIVHLTTTTTQHSNSGMTETTTITSNNSSDDEYCPAASPSSWSVTSNNSSSAIINTSFAWSNDSIDATCKLWMSDSTERDLLVQLGQRVSDIRYYKNTPDELIRFLHAKSGDLAAAEHMFRTSVEWRRTTQADDALNRPPPPGLIDAIPGAILEGTDHDGEPIFVNRVGTFDIIGAYKQFGREEIIHHCIWIRELVSRGTWRAQREQATGRPMKQLLIIEDLKGIPLSKLIASPHILSLYGELMRIDQENYPDASKKIIVIRTPALFRMAWNLVKPFFDKYVVEKMVFCGFHDYENVLSQYVDLKVLPPDLLPGIGQGKAELGMPQRFDGGRVLVSR